MKFLTSVLAVFLGGLLLTCCTLLVSKFSSWRRKYKKREFKVKCQSLRRWSWLIIDKKGKVVREYNKSSHSPALRKAIMYSKKLNKRVN